MGAARSQASCLREAILRRQGLHRAVLAAPGRYPPQAQPSCRKHPLLIPLPAAVAVQAPCHKILLLLPLPLEGVQALRCLTSPATTSQSHDGSGAFREEMEPPPTQEASEVGPTPAREADP